MLSYFLEKPISNEDLKISLAGLDVTESFVKLALPQIKEGEEVFLEMLQGPSLQFTLAMFNDAKAEFIKRYISKPTNNSNFAQPLYIKWESLVDEVTNSGINPDRAILYLIHRYDTAQDAWFITVEICKFDTLVGVGTPGTLYDIIHTGIYFDIVPDSNLAKQTDVNSLGVANGNPFGTDYFAPNVQYAEDCINYVDVVQGTNSQATLISWFEVNLMYQHNIASINPAPALAEIAFCSITSDFGVTQYARFPHTSTIHTRFDNVNRIKNGSIVSSGLYFNNKAGDFQGVCPPSCLKYPWPVGLI